MTRASQKSSMWDLSDRIDEAMESPIAPTNDAVVEKFDFLKKLFGRKTSPQGMKDGDYYQDYEDVKDYKDEIEDAVEEPVEEPIEEPIEITKASKAPTTHIKSYAVARGNGFLRVAVDGDKKLTKARLHIFKKGGRYFGFLTIPGPGRQASESFNRSLDIIIFEATSDIVLKYDSDSLEDLFNLSNYKKRSSLESGKFKKYEDSVDILDRSTAKKADIGRLPWGKQRRQEIGGEEPTEIDIDVLKKLADRYEQLADDASDTYTKAFYENLYSALPKVTSKDQIEHFVTGMDKAIKNYSKKDDNKSRERIDLISSTKDELLSAVENID